MIPVSMTQETWRVEAIGDQKIHKARGEIQGIFRMNQICRGFTICSIGIPSMLQQDQVLPAVSQNWTYPYRAVSPTPQNESHFQKYWKHWQEVHSRAHAWELKRSIPEDRKTWQQLWVGRPEGEPKMHFAKTSSKGSWNKLKRDKFRYSFALRGRGPAGFGFEERWWSWCLECCQELLSWAVHQLCMGVSPRQTLRPILMKMETYYVKC